MNKKFILPAILCVMVFGIGLMTNKDQPEVKIATVEQTYRVATEVIAEADEAIMLNKRIDLIENKGFDRTLVKTAIYDSLVYDQSTIVDQIQTYKEDGFELTIGEESYLLSSIDSIEHVMKNIYDYEIKDTYTAEITVDITETLDIYTIATCESKDNKLLEVGLIEPVSIKAVEGFVTDFITQEAATEKLTHLTEEKMVYTVVSGDVPSLISQRHDMNLTDLYEMNPGLQDGATSLQIGQELMLNMPKSLATVYTVSEEVREESLPMGVTFVENTDNYIGTDSTVTSGSDGAKEVVEKVKKVGDLEVEKEVVREVVLSLPENAVVSRGTRTLPIKGEVGKYISPLASYTLTSPFGYRWGRQHTGADLAAPTGTNVRASNGGVVTKSQYRGELGYFVEIDHGGGVKTLYAHNSELLVSVGQIVSQYEVIALVGSTGKSTGPHVHFEIIIDGVQMDPMNYIN